MVPPQIEDPGILIVMLKLLRLLDLGPGLGIDVILSDPAQATVSYFYLLHKGLVVKSLGLLTLFNRCHLSDLLLLVFLFVVHVNVHDFAIKLVVLEGVRVAIVLFKG